MSELIEARRGEIFIRNKLLNTVSALVLVGYVSLASASAENTDRPTVWIELGGQMEAMQGTSSPFIAPFMTAISPTPGPYANDIFLRNQQPARLAFGLEGKAIFQPEGSDWVFSASLRYGRSQTDRHSHQQSPVSTFQDSNRTVLLNVAPFAQAKSKYEESHTILDFSVGKDVGLGAFGRSGTSTFNVGVRFAQFSEKSNATATGRPSIHVVGHQNPSGFRVRYSFYNYTMFAQAARSFHGVGPSLSWNASAALLGNKDAGELTFDWGIDGSVLFGRQNAKTSHRTQAYHMPITTPYHGDYDGYYYTRAPQKSHQGARVGSRSVVVPNLGGFVGLSVKYPNMKFSLGYRADFFFGAVDAGIDARRTKNLGFNGPFASISIGFGG